MGRNHSRRGRFRYDRKRQSANRFGLHPEHHRQPPPDSVRAAPQLLNGHNHADSEPGNAEPSCPVCAVRPTDKVPNKRHLPITPSTRIIPGDLRDEAFCQRRVSEAVRGLGGLDIIVSNAGRQQSHEMITDISVEHFDWTITSRRPYRYANQLPPATGCSHSSSARSS